MSARELARRIAIDQSYISLVLAGRRAPSRRLLEASAEALRLPVDYWREYREIVILEGVRASPELLERVYRIVGGAR